MNALNKTTSAYRLAKKIERLITFGNPELLYQGAELIVWAHKFKKLPDELLDAFIDKVTLLFADDWYGDEDAQQTINHYLK